MGNSRSNLDWPEGRREAFKLFSKDASYYAKYGVRSSESYIRNSRSVEFFTKEWYPLAGPIKGLVFYCHGYGATCAYFFDDVAIRLAKAQYAVFGIDNEGHGRSEGLHAYISSFKTLVEDVMEFCDSVKGRVEFEGLPTFLYGESMGGATALKVHFQQPTAWTGAILIAPMCKLEFPEEYIPPYAVVRLLKGLVRCLPTLKAFGSISPTHFLEIGFREPSKRKKAYQSPTGYLQPIRLATALELWNTTVEIEGRMEEVSVPILILHGAADGITSPSASKELYRRANSQKILKIYPDSWHCLTSGEPDEIVEQVMEDILRWLDLMVAGRNGELL